MFSSEFCEILKNTFFKERFWATASRFGFKDGVSKTSDDNRDIFHYLSFLKTFKCFYLRCFLEIQIGIKKNESKIMDLVNIADGGTYDEINISGWCTLCIMKSASFVCFYILCSTITSKSLTNTNTV